MITPSSEDLTLNVELISGAVIKCGSKGGNLHVKWKKANNEPLQVTWTGVGVPAPGFQLQFHAVLLESDTGQPSAKPFWPFTGTPPANGLTPTPANSFTFTLAEQDFVCKYSIIIGNLRLDPIIIVEK